MEELRPVSILKFKQFLSSAALLLIVFQLNMSAEYGHIQLKLVSGLITRVVYQASCPAPEPPAFIARRQAIPVCASGRHVRKMPPEFSSGEFWAQKYPFVFIKNEITHKCIQLYLVIRNINPGQPSIDIHLLNISVIYCEYLPFQKQHRVVDIQFVRGYYNQPEFFLPSH